MKVRCLVVAIILFACSPALSQRFHVHTYTELDGLPSTEVRGVVRDSEGLIWFATRKGIVAYDGISWRNFDEDDGLADANQNLLAIDAEGHLWSASFSPSVHVSRRDSEGWKLVVRIPKEFGRATALVPVDGAGNSAWIGTPRGLLLIEQGTVTEVSGHLNGPLPVFDLLPWNDGLVAATQEGLFEVEVEDGLARLNRVAEVPDLPIQGLALHGSGDRIWLIGRDWVGSYDGTAYSGKSHYFDDSGAKQGDQIKAVAGPAGGLIFGTSRSLFQIEPGGPLTRLGEENGLIGEGALDIFVDGGIIWIGSTRGVSKIVSRRFANFNNEDGLLEDEVSAILERSDGTFVLGHRSGITFFGENPQTLRLGESMTSRVLDLAEDAAGNVWAAAYMNGLFRVSPELQLEHYPVRADWNGRVNSVVVDRENRVWFSTNGGLFRIEGDRFVDVPISVGIRGAGLRRLFLDAEGRIVIGTVGRGLFRFENGRWRHWLGASAMINNVYAYLDRGNESPFVGSTAGLFTTNGERLVKASVPAIDRPIYFIVEDDRRRTWFGTDNGVFRWDGGDLQHFSMKNGLIGRETNRAAGNVDSSDRVWIGTERGLSIYRPKFDSTPTQKPELRLLGLEAGGRMWSPGESPTLSYNQSTLVFSYRATSFVDERAIQIRTRLEGLEADWQTPVPLVDGSVRYNYLAPGAYRLHLQAVSAEGVPSEVVSSPRIRIRSPFWRSSWFYVLAMFSMAALGYGIRLVVTHRRDATRLEREVAARITELRRAEERYRVTLTSIVEGVITTSTDGSVLLMNKAAERITGSTHADIQGQNVGSVLSLEHEGRSVTPDILDQIVKGGSWSAAEPLNYTTSTGQLLKLELSGAPIREGSVIRGAVFAFRDVTERLQLERETINAQRIRSIGVLAGGIAHDFNNLLAVVLGNLPQLEAGLNKEEDLQHAKTIESAVMRARELTQQLIAFSRGGAAVMKTMRIDDVIKHAVSFALSGTNSECNVNLAHDLWAVKIDPGQINQVLNNLLINAIQAMPNGGTIRLSAKNLPGESSDRHGRRTVEITVHDEGSGIQTDELPFIFDPYYSTKKDGHGLGLATSYWIIQQHGGRISVESERGRGTTFRIQLPASDADPVDLSSAKPATQSEKRRILVVDDDPDVRKAVGKMLETLGHQVDFAEEGRKAIELYRNSHSQDSPYGVLLLDLTIRGGMGGGEAIEHLIKIDPNVRAIVMSGYSDDSYMSNHKDYGFCACIRKPFSLEELRQGLEACARGVSERPRGGVMSSKPAKPAI